jgi:hypothetical protein
MYLVDTNVWLEVLLVDSSGLKQALALCNNTR